LGVSGMWGIAGAADMLSIAAAARAAGPSTSIDDH